jgi:serine protease Do
MNRRLAPFLILTAFVLGGLLLPRIQISFNTPPTLAVPGGSLGVAPGPADHALAPEEVFARAAQAASPSVVNIDTLQRVRVRGFFFEDDHYEENANQGSGVIITPDGYILTNQHVVGSSESAGKRIMVTLSNGKKYPGTVIGADHTTDVALVKVDAAALPAAKIGTSEGLMPGQICVAIGNPLGFKFTVTNGVIGGLKRPLAMPDGRVYGDLIQHDALINPGNSGGALVDRLGRLVGINTLVDRRGPGIGFAIPIDTALRVADELKRFGKVKRPWLGLVTATNNRFYVERYGLPDTAGALVRGFYRGGPGVGSGLKPGDIIVKVNDKPVKTEEDFKAAERALKIGQRATIDVVRGDRTGRATLTVGEAP